MLWVAATDKGITGVVTLEGDPPEIGLIAGLRPGLGGELLRHAVRAASVAGAAHVSVTSQSRNSRALRLYAAAGFTEVERRAVYHWWQPV